MKRAQFKKAKPMRKFTVIILLSVLSACQFNVTPTFYVRDIQDVIASRDPINLPIFMQVPASSMDDCQSEIGQVLGILETYGMIGKLQSCNSDESALFATANIELEASVMRVDDQNQDNMTGALALGIEDKGDGYYGLYLARNPKLEAAMTSIESALIFATLDATNVGFVVTINNDMREALFITTYDSFVNGAPYDEEEFILKPRSVLKVRASDVSTNLFFNRGWYEIGVITFSS
jgi:hypothetical protein